MCHRSDNARNAAALQNAEPKDLHHHGAKDDSGKVPVDMIFEYFPRALIAVAEVADYGAKKYTRGGWVEVPNGFQRYSGAMNRHILWEHIDPDGLDPETKLTHAAHIAWNALARLELLLRKVPRAEK